MLTSCLFGPCPLVFLPSSTICRLVALKSNNSVFLFTGFLLWKFYFYLCLTFHISPLCYAYQIVTPPHLPPVCRICRKCNAMNFARRQECFRCYAPGGAGGGGYDDRGRGGGYDDRGRGGGYDDRGRGYDDRRGGYVSFASLNFCSFM